MNTNELFFKPEPKQRSKTRKTWNTKKTKTSLGANVCGYILLAHAILGCNTTSRIHDIGKGVALTKIRTNTLFREQANIFNHPGASKDEVIMAGEKALLCLYNCRPDESLDSLRYTKFCENVATGTTLVQAESLPPTSAATEYHSLRVYLQIQQWKGVPLEPDWGLKLMENCFQLQQTCHQHMNPS